MASVDLSPGAFAFVMATGIVAHDAELASLAVLGTALLWIAVAGYVMLAIYLVAQLCRCPRRLLTEIGSPRGGPGFLTLVAATCVVGTEIVPVDVLVATGLWVVGALLGLGLTYAVLASVAANERKGRASAGLSGAWLLVVVAAQSVALLATLVARQFGGGRQLVLLIALVAFCSGCILYLVLIPPIVHRLEFVYLPPREFTPDHWIDMGAMAISALTGSALISAASQWMFLQQVSPFLLGLTLAFWAGATWWVPLLVLLEAWRHVLRRVPLAYDTAYWSMVFPIGMYAASTFAIASLTRVGVVTAAAQWLVYVALAVWVVVASALVHAAVEGAMHRSKRTRPSPGQ